MARGQGVKISREKISQAYALYLTDNFSPPKIASKLGVGVATVRKWIRTRNWADKKADSEVRIAATVQSKLENKEVNYRVQALRRLRLVGQTSEDALTKGVTTTVMTKEGPSEISLGPLKPITFGDAAHALTQAIRQEAELEGWKPLAPQIVAIIVEDRKKIALALVKLVTQTVIPRIPQSDRNSVLAMFKQELDDFEKENIDKPPMLPASYTVHGKGAEESIDLDDI
jgi:hypothetical protein